MSEDMRHGIAYLLYIAMALIGAVLFLSVLKDAYIDSPRRLKKYRESEKRAWEGIYAKSVISVAFHVEQCEIRDNKFVTPPKGGIQF